MRTQAFARLWGGKVTLWEESQRSSVGPLSGIWALLKGVRNLEGRKDFCGESPSLSPTAFLTPFYVCLFQDSWLQIQLLKISKNQSSRNLQNNLGSSHTLKRHANAKGIPIFQFQLILSDPSVSASLINTSLAPSERRSTQNYGFQQPLPQVVKISMWVTEILLPSSCCCRRRHTKNNKGVRGYYVFGQSSWHTCTLSGVRGGVGSKCEEGRN